MIEYLLTPEEWIRVLGLGRVRDADGWWNKAWDEPLTYGEFQMRYSISTVELLPRASQSRPAR